MVFPDYFNPNTSINIIIDLLRPVDERAGNAFSGQLNVENEHSETLKKVLHKLNRHHNSFLYKTLNVVFVYYYYSNLSFH